jgi:hypothetical protein
MSIDNTPVFVSAVVTLLETGTHFFEAIIRLRPFYKGHLQYSHTDLLSQPGTFLLNASKTIEYSRVTFLP